MTMLVPRRVSTALRWLAPTLIACVCAIASSATANATWNQAEFDACTTRADTAWLEGDISNADHIYFYELCCGRSGGAWTPHGNQGLGVCGTPAVAASTPSAPPSEAANPDVPGGPPPPSPASSPISSPTPTKPPPKSPSPKPTLTLTPVAPVG